MLNKQLLNRLKELHPEFTTEEIKTVISSNITVINHKLCKAQTIYLDIPKLGVIHTHSNVINVANKRKVKMDMKFAEKQFRYSTNNLLF